MHASHCSFLLRIGAPSRNASVALGFVVLGMLTPLACGAGDTGAATTADTAAHPYVIFAGLDLFVDDHGNRRPVVGGSESEVVIWDERKDGVATLHNVALSATVEPKVARAQLVIDELAGRPVYSPNNDPAAAAQAQQFFLLNLENARAEEAEFDMRIAVAVADSFGAMAAAGGGSGPAYNARMSEAASQAAAAIGEAASTYANPVYRDSQIGNAETGGNHDGFAVSFTVSSAEPTGDIYGALRLQARNERDPKAPPMHALKLFHVPKLGAKPRKVTVRQYGIPPEYTVKTYQIHFYARGRELATTVVPNRLEVSAEEAHQFLLLRHQQVHARATISAQMAPELRRDLPANLRGQGVENVAVDLSITAEGRVDAVSGARGLPERFSAEILEAVRHVRLLPALVDGKAVTSEGTFTVGELFNLSP